MPTTRTLTITAVVLLLAATGQAQTPTFSRADYATADAPRGITTADFNRDGALDLALVNTGRTSVAILINETTVGRGRGVAVADLDWDGAPDIVYSQFYLDSVQILHGDGAGNFTARLGPIATGPRPQGW